MTLQEFFDKWDIDSDLIDETHGITDVFDQLYLRYTRDQVVNMILDYYDNADDLHNDAVESFEKGLFA